MNEATSKSFQKWAVTREKGKWRFVLQTGVLAWGVPMFVIMTFFLNRRPDTPLSIGMIAISALIWAIGGACYGLAMWTVSERKYRKFLESIKSAESSSTNAS